MPLASALALLWLAAPSPALHHGGAAAPDAWAARVAGGIAVCWSPGPDCFEPVRIDPSAHTPHQRRLAPGWAVAFEGPSRAILVDADGWVWSVREGQRSATPWRQENPLPRTPRPPRRLHCGPAGPLPVQDGARLVFAWVPCAGDSSRAALRCAARLPPPPRRRISRVEIDVWLDAAGVLLHRHADQAIGQQRHGTVLLGLSLAIAPLRRARFERARALASTASVHTIRVPAVDPGPLARPELDALWRALCEGPPPWTPDPTAPS